MYIKFEFMYNVNNTWPKMLLFKTLNILSNEYKQLKKNTITKITSQPYI